MIQIKSLQFAFLFDLDFFRSEKKLYLSFCCSFCQNTLQNPFRNVLQLRFSYIIHPVEYRGQHLSKKKKQERRTN